MVSFNFCFFSITLYSKYLPLFLQWYEKFTGVDEVIPVSAKYGHGVEDVKDWILSKLPAGPAYYPKVCTIIILLSFVVFLLHRNK